MDKYWLSKPNSIDGLEEVLDDINNEKVEQSNPLPFLLELPAAL
jgi:hypothetical protein